MAEMTPPPLVPADCDLRDYPSMLLDVSRLRDSGLASDESPEACWAAVLLWAAAWHQVPAASIPDNDNWIAKHAGYSVRGKVDRAWTKVRYGALRLFVKCEDGRLYHPVVAEKALECWLDKLGRALSSGAGNAKRWKIEFDPKPIEAQMAHARGMLSALNPQSRALAKRRTSGVLITSGSDPTGTPDAVPSGSQEKGREDEGKKKESSVADATDAAASPPAEPTTPKPSVGPEKSPEEMAKAELWRAAVSVLEQGGCPVSQCRTFMGKLVGDYGFPVVQKAVGQAVTAQPADAREYLRATCQRLKGERIDAPTVASDSADKTAEYLREQQLTPEQKEANAERARQIAAQRGKRGVAA